ncbi:hypothetical protein [Carboxydothermus pertinax]|uniref:Uncharacterized protein n=1 Tax=Carboxydothermus pertinax TaxID=870242 RepID=A0A1L8CVW3_9THEO|nr:hypothetical protein [Carboxydothermus pertinax]GAV23050.1 hypothetical protein cpu_15600 [Carboxydothermus pertinax]
MAYYKALIEVPDPNDPENGKIATNYIDRNSPKLGVIPTIDLPPELQGKGIKYAVVDPTKTTDNPDDVKKLKFLQENGKYIIVDCYLFNPEKRDGSYKVIGKAVIMGEWKDKYDHYAYVKFKGVDEKNILDYVPVTVVNWNETEIIKNPLPIKNTNVKGITTRTVTLYTAPNSKTKAATLPKGKKVTYTFLKDEKYYGWKEVKWDEKVKTYVTQKYYVTVKYYKKVKAKK